MEKTLKRLGIGNAKKIHEELGITATFTNKIEIIKCVYIVKNVCITVCKALTNLFLVFNTIYLFICHLINFINF